MNAPEPEWLTWSRELQAIAQTGLAYTDGPYDRERYARLRELASSIMARHAELPAPEIVAIFSGETGYATPKVDVRGAVFDDDGRLLMVRETSDAGRWTLPGGWADVHLTPAQNVVKEIREESGYDARVVKLAAAWDRTHQGHGPRVFSATKLFFVCDLVGGAARPSLETSEIAWFSADALPIDLSTERTLPHQLARMFAHARDPSLATEFD